MVKFFPYLFELKCRIVNLFLLYESYEVRLAKVLWVISS